MNSNLDKEIAVTRIKAVGLMQRTKSVLALAELVSEFIQLTDIQQKQINALCSQLKAYEEESPQLASGPVPEPAPTPAGRNTGPSSSPDGAGAQAVRSAEVERDSGEVPRG